MKRVLAAIIGLVLTLALPTMVRAEHIKGSTDWYVEYNESGEVVDNYTQKSWADNVSQLQPGDDITLEVEVRQTNDTPADWYLTNEVLKSLEDGDASGGAYGYKLSYEGPSNSRTLYESKSIGGRGSAEGLAEATNAMDDYFFLGTLEKGQTGKVVIQVALDGETESNVYFDTLARLKLKFAVEPTVSEPTTKENVVDEEEVVEVGGGQQTVVNRTVSPNRQRLSKTGDPTTMLPLYLAIAGLGIVCLALAIRNVRSKKNKEEGDAQ